MELEKEPLAVPTAGGSLRVLVVDDSQAMHEIMRVKLGALAVAAAIELQLDHALSGEEALRRAEAADYDLVFMDVEMPGMGGYEACRQIKAFGRNVRIAMLSSLARLSDREMGYRMGCDHYLEKPPKDQVLGAILRVAGLRKELCRS